MPNYSIDSSAYHYDPNNPVPTIGGFDFFGLFNPDSILFGPRNINAINNRSDVLIFTTDVLNQPLAVVGQPIFTLFASSDKLDTDFVIMLADVYPDGRSILISEGILKARFRNGFSSEELLNPNQIYQFSIKLRHTAYVFNKNHKIRIYITSSKYPSYEPNPNNGGPFKINDPNKLVALNKVFSGYIYPTNISLPVNNAIIGEREIIADNSLYCFVRNKTAMCGKEIPSYLFDVMGRKVSNKNLKKGVYMGFINNKRFKVFVY
jgi:putative CocE/NonD family hydrolase